MLKSLANLSFFCLLGMAALAAPAAFAADYRIGVVNPIQVLEAAPQAADTRKLLEKEFAARDRELVAAQKELKKNEDRLAKDGAIMSEGERAQLERTIVNQRRDLKRDQDEFREDVNFRRNEEFGKIQREIVTAIQAVATEKKFDLILGEGVIFASDRVDITEEIVSQMKKQYAGGN